MIRMGSRLTMGQKRHLGGAGADVGGGGWGRFTTIAQKEPI